MTDADYDKQKALAALLGVSPDKLGSWKDNAGLTFDYKSPGALNRREFRVYRETELQVVFSGTEWFYVAEEK